MVVTEEISSNPRVPSELLLSIQNADVIRLDRWRLETTPNPALRHASSARGGPMPCH